MQLIQEHEENFTTIKVENSRLDASIAPDFKRQMEDIIEHNKHHIILDISSVSFMDSSSLGAMVALLKSIKKHGELVISGASGTVLDLFQLTRMDSVFTLTKDVSDAQNELH